MYLGETIFCVYAGTVDVVILGSWGLAAVVAYLRR